MARKVLLSLTAALVLAVFGFGAWRLSAAAPPKRAAEAYVRALASGDAETALDYSSGSAAFAASRLRGSKVTAKVEDVSCSVAALGRGWARVLTTVELTLQDGTADVGWYTLDVVKAGREWKVVSFREAEPEISGTGLFVKKTDVAAAKQVFESYLDGLAAGDWQGAAKFLVGPIRRNQEMGAAVLGKGAVIGKTEGLQAEPAWERGKSLVVKLGYRLEGKYVSVITAFYRTGQGWKIAKIIQD